MKCTNCGFECDSNFCPMCGAKAVDNQPLQQPQQFNTYSNTNPQPAPYVQPPVQNFGNQPLPQQPLSGNAQMPVSQPPVTNQQVPNAVYSQGFPSMQPPVQPVKMVKKKSNKKALSIVFFCLIAVVIAAGAAINIVSACNDQHTIMENITELSKSSNDLGYSDYSGSGSDYDYSEYGDYDYNLGVYDDTVYKMGEKAKITDGTISLTKIEKADITSDTYKDLNVYSISFEITNNSDKSAYYTNQNILASASTSWVDDADYSYSSISDDIEYNDKGEFEVEAGKNKTITLLYSLSKEATTVDINFMCDRNFYKNSTVTSGSYDLYFRAEIPE